MPWQQLRLVTDRAQSEWLSEWLFTLDALSVTFVDAADEPIYEPLLDTTPLWHSTQLVALFSYEQDLTELIEFIKVIQANGTITSYQLEVLQDKNWLKEVSQSWQPQKFGNRLWICPSWQKIEFTTACVITLDPGLAFGTGSHPTTALCLEWLDSYLRPGQTLIDYGCGSGILAIAAKKLGAGKIWAIDHDSQALQATENNARTNAVFDKDFTIAAPEAFTHAQADVLIANILAQPLIQLAEHFTALLKPQGTLVLSGILNEQITEVQAAYKNHYTFHTLAAREEWALLAAQKCRNA